MDLPVDAALPHSLHFRTIAFTIARSDATSGSSTLTSTLGLHSRPTAPLLLPSAHRLLSTAPRSSRNPDPASTSSCCPSPADSSSSVAVSASFRLCEELQCSACRMWGHSMQRCSQLARHTLLVQFSITHSTDARRAASAWQQLHSVTPCPPAVSRCFVQHQPSPTPSLMSSMTLMYLLQTLSTLSICTLPRMDYPPSTLLFPMLRIFIFPGSAPLCY